MEITLPVCTKNKTGIHYIHPLGDGRAKCMYCGAILGTKFNTK